jgi:hypothetical protein
MGPPVAAEAADAFPDLPVEDVVGALHGVGPSVPAKLPQVFLPEYQPEFRQSLLPVR